MAGPSLTELLHREGSDKGKWYGGLYDVILRPYRESIRCVVEIGIGTMIPDAPSSMAGWGGEGYRPGASLRAFRDFLPNAQIHGVDVAPDTQLTGEPRIRTHLCDSRDTDRVRALFADGVAPADLIVDDGLHEAAAQVATLANFLPFLRAGGLYVVEDVVPGDVPAILAALPRVHAGCRFFVDGRTEPWVAIVIQKP